MGEKGLPKWTASLRQHFPLPTSPEDTLSFFHKHVRVLTPNMIFVQDLPPEWLDSQLLSATAFFGQYGSIEKISLASAPHSRHGAPPSANITFSSCSEAVRAIVCSNHFSVNQRRLRVSLGMSKFCFRALLGKKCASLSCDFVHRVPSHANDLFRVRGRGSFQLLGEAESLALLHKWGIDLDLDRASAADSPWSVLPSISDMRPVFRKLQRLCRQKAFRQFDAPKN